MFAVFVEAMAAQSIAAIITQRLPHELHEWCNSLGDDGIIAIVKACGDAAMNAQRIENAAESKLAAGPRGEDYVFGLLRSCASSVEITAHKPHKGDMIAEYQGRRILVDSKNYAPGRTVPSSEIDKFKRDLEASGGCDGGILVSLGGGFAGMARRQLAWERVMIGARRLPIIYLTLSHGDAAKNAYHAECIAYALDAISQYDRHEEMTCLSMQEVCVHLDYLSTCRDMLMDLQASLSKQIMKSSATIMSAEMGLRAALRRQTPPNHTTPQIPEAADHQS